MADFRYEILKGVPFVAATATGKVLTFNGRFIIDTGAHMTIIRTPRVDAMGYSARDATRPFSTDSAIGRESGYCVRIKSFEALGKKLDDFEIAALDLPSRYNIDGLIGMNLLGLFGWCLHPDRMVISVR